MIIRAFCMRIITSRFCILSFCMRAVAIGLCIITFSMSPNSSSLSPLTFCMRIISRHIGICAFCMAIISIGTYYCIIAFGVDAIGKSLCSTSFSVGAFPKSFSRLPSTIITCRTLGVSTFSVSYRFNPFRMRTLSISLRRASFCMSIHSYCTIVVIIIKYFATSGIGCFSNSIVV